MNLYIKQKLLSLKDKYKIYDVNENLMYYVESEFFTIGAKLHVFNSQGEEEFYIKKRITFMLAQYEIYQNNTLCATINQKFSFLRPKLTVDSVYGELQVNGEFLNMNYEIKKNNGEYFGGIHKKWMSWGDTYELDIPNEESAGFLCALVIAIDNCLHNGDK